MLRTAHLIFNPVSGQGDAEADLAYVRSQLDPAFDLTVYETSPERDADRLAAQSVQQGVDLVIASGGDGTINAAAESLMETAIPLAIIPRGTANAVASALGIPTNLHDACQVVLTGESHAIDTARCNGRPMVLLAGIGLEADVVKRASRETKDRWGILAYILAGFKELNELDSFEVTLETDDKVISVQACAITVANMAPPTSILAQGPEEVVVDDGLLDITIVAAKGVGSALAASYELFRSAISGQATEREDIGFLRSKRVKINTAPLQNVALDGEVLGEVPIEVICVPQGLNLVVPRQTSPSPSENIVDLPGITIESKR
ncbi:MAG: YegS/Rv2252/BmrU family lipid kinase [Leptolyngbyaceae cyanobacterium]